MVYSGRNIFFRIFISEQYSPLQCFRLYSTCLHPVDSSEISMDALFLPLAVDPTSQDHLDRIKGRLEGQRLLRQDCCNIVLSRKGLQTNKN